MTYQITKKLEKPLIEAFTLDSATCAACGYMMNVVNELHDEYSSLFDKVGIQIYKERKHSKVN